MTAATDRPTQRARHWTALPWIVLAIGIPASFLLFTVVRDAVESVARLRFERQAGDTHAVIENRLHPYAGLLYGLRAFFASESSVTRLRFHRYVESLDLKHRYPGFDALNYAAYVPVKDKKSFEEAVRRDTSLDPRGYPQFAIKPAGERSEYFVIVYLEPMAGFKEFAFGLDVSSNPAQAADPQALTVLQHYVRDSGKLTASGMPIRVRTAKSQYTGLAMRLAVYRSGMPVDTVEQRRAAYVGSVGAGFNIDYLMKDVLDEKMLRDMRVMLYDAGPTSDRPDFPSSVGKRLLFDSTRLIQTSPARSVVEDPKSEFTHVLPIEVAGRIWEIHFSVPKAAVIARVDQLLPSMVFAGGLLSTFLLFGVFYSLSSSRTRALRLAAQMTKDLRETEERFRRIAENASDLIALIDPQGRRVYVNPAYDVLFGDHKAMTGSNSFDDVHPEDRERVRQSFFDTVNDGKARRTEFRFLLPNGEVRHIESQASAVLDAYGKVALVVRVSRDVTERRQTEEALRAREVQLQEAQNLAKLGHWEWDVQTGKRTWSEQVMRNFGVADAGSLLTFEDFLALVHPDDRERTRRLLREAIEAGTVYENEYRVIAPDGGVRIIYARARIDRDESGQAVRLLGVSQDVTDRKLAEEQVRATEERFRTMVENVRDYAIYMLDPRGYITSWNLGAERIKGYLADETIGKHYSLF
ncbi:MAG TPA: CHASE domain-containing protein, partial [Bradyrhizobium sp.]|nr:CHASE domain-containing protein [Bradyrhizobium sp.]